MKSRSGSTDRLNVYPVTRIAGVLADPFGHGLCLIQFLGRGYDEIVAPGEVRL